VRDLLECDGQRSTPTSGPSMMGRSSPAGEEATMGPAVTVLELDHVVLNVADVDRSLHFYCHELGLGGVRVEQWQRDEVPFPSVRVNDMTIIDLLHAPRSGENTDHFCLVVEPTDLEALRHSGRFDVVEGPVQRFGAQGEGTSLYIRDPDHNVVELRHYNRRGARELRAPQGEA
jgi:catechol 2,3-dioxygenase-like lactoylglutathione lyase family enzyme